MNSNVCYEVASSLMPVMAGRPEGKGQSMSKDKGKVFADLFSQNLQNQDLTMSTTLKLLTGLETLEVNENVQEQILNQEDMFLTAKNALNMLEGLETREVNKNAREQSQIQEDVFLTEELLDGMDTSEQDFLGIQMAGFLAQPIEMVQVMGNKDCGLRIQDTGSEVKGVAEGMKTETQGHAISIVAADPEKPPDKVQRLHLVQQTFQEALVSDRESTKTLPPGQWKLIQDQSPQNSSRRTQKEGVPKGTVLSDRTTREELPLQRAIVQNMNLDKREVEFKLEPQPASGDSVTDSEIFPDRNQIVQQMVKSIESSRWDKGEFLRVRLEPEYLGELRIEIQKTETGCIARISAQKQSVEKVLAPRIEEISNLLSERMIKVDQIIVDTLRPEVVETSLMNEFNQSGLMQQNMADGESQTHQGSREQSDISCYSMEVLEEEQNQETDDSGINIVI
jgi:flagellar hook-length control protein FliK